MRGKGERGKRGTREGNRRIMGKRGAGRGRRRQIYYCYVARVHTISLVPRPSTLPVFDCCKRSKTGGVNGLGTRLAYYSPEQRFFSYRLSD